MSRVLVTGVGLVTALGVGTDETWEALVAGRSGVGTIRSYDPSALRTQLAAEIADFDPEQFTPADHAALAEAWSWLGVVAERALTGGLGGMVDDDLAYVAPWGFDPAEVRVPVLLVHGGQDRVVPSSHGRWLAGRIPSAELWLRPEDGHVSVLGSAEAALGWLREHAGLG